MIEFGPFFCSFHDGNIDKKYFFDICKGYSLHYLLLIHHHTYKHTHLISCQAGLSLYEIAWIPTGSVRLLLLIRKAKDHAWSVTPYEQTHIFDIKSVISHFYQLQSLLVFYIMSFTDFSNKVAPLLMLLGV